MADNAIVPTRHTLFRHRAAGRGAGIRGTGICSDIIEPLAFGFAIAIRVAAAVTSTVTVAMAFAVSVSLRISIATAISVATTSVSLRTTISLPVPTLFGKGKMLRKNGRGKQGRCRKDSNGSG